MSTVILLPTVENSVPVPLTTTPFVGNAAASTAACRLPHEKAKKASVAPITSLSTLINLTFFFMTTVLLSTKAL